MRRPLLLCALLWLAFAQGNTFRFESRIPLPQGTEEIGLERCSDLLDGLLSSTIAAAPAAGCYLNDFEASSVAVHFSSALTALGYLKHAENVLEGEIYQAKWQAGEGSPRVLSLITVQLDPVGSATLVLSNDGSLTEQAAASALGDTLLQFLEQVRHHPDYTYPALVAEARASLPEGAVEFPLDLCRQLLGASEVLNLFSFSLRSCYHSPQTQGQTYHHLDLKLVLLGYEESYHADEGALIFSNWRKEDEVRVSFILVAAREPLKGALLFEIDALASLEAWQSMP